MEKGMKRLSCILLAAILLILSTIIPSYAANKVEIILKPTDKNFVVSNRQIKVWKISDEKLIDDPVQKAKEFEKLSEEELDNIYKEFFISEKSDNNGRIILENLKDGTYYVRELGEVDGRLAPFFILMPMDEDVVYPKVELKTTEATEPTEPTGPSGDHHFQKVGEDGKTPLKDAVFKVNIKEGDYYEDYLVDGKPYIIRSDKDGKFIVEDLPYGTYYLKEIIPPEGYKALSGTIKFEISEKSGQSEIVVKNNKEETTETDTVEKDDNEKKKPSDETDTVEKDDKNKIKVPKTGDITLIVLIIAGALLFYIGKKLIKE